jgi:hypothetical protein
MSLGLPGLEMDCIWLPLVRCRSVEHRFRQENGASRYEFPIPLPIEAAAGDADRLQRINYPTDNNLRYPVFTFTRDRSVLDGADLGVPAFGYVQNIAAGLRSATRVDIAPNQFSVMSDAHIVDYLHQAPGANTLDRLDIELAVSSHLEDEWMSEREVELLGVPPIVRPGVAALSDWSDHETTAKSNRGSRKAQASDNAMR